MLLTLSQNCVRLFECTEEDIRRLDANDIPESVSDALGYDWEQQSLQFHTGAQPSGGAGSERRAVFHGHGRGGDADTEELSRFLDRVDAGLIRLLGQDGPPLVVAGVRRDVTEFVRSAKYTGVQKQFIEGSPDHLTGEDLHAEAFEKVRPALERSAERLRSRFLDAAHTEHVCRGLEEALPAASGGRVEGLFVRANRPVWGVFDAEKKSVRTHDARTAESEDLVDRAIVEAVRTGASVQAAGSEALTKGTAAAALLRY
jgi:hypothetical protein